MRIAFYLLFSLAAAAALPTAAMPGFRPREYANHERVPLRMHEMRSPTQPGVTRNYYDLPGVCTPASTATTYENFGEALSGGLSQDGVIGLRLGRDIACTTLCTHRLTAGDVRVLHARVEDGYRVQMSADGLPIVQQSIYHGFVLRVPRTRILTPQINPKRGPLRFQCRLGADCALRHGYVIDRIPQPPYGRLRNAVSRT